MTSKIHLLEMGDRDESSVSQNPMKVTVGPAIHARMSFTQLKGTLGFFERHRASGSRTLTSIYRRDFA